MVKQDLINFVASTERVIASYREALRKSASESQDKPEMRFDDVALLKVASDVHTLYGKPSNIKPEQLVEHWQANPNSLVGTLQKMASAQLAHVASGNHLGAPSERIEGRKEDQIDLDADDAFKNKYSNR
jgi:hypothetical protein